MAVLTLGTDTTGMIGQTRLLCQDTNSAAYALSTAQVTSIINEKYLWYKDEAQERTVVVTPTALVAEKYTGVGVGLMAGRNLTTSTTYKKILAIIRATPITVTLCNTNSNTTITTAGSGFSTVRVGSEVVGTDIVTGTTVSSISASGGTITLSQAATGTNTFLTMKFYSPDASVGAPLERVEINEFYDAYNSGINAYALEREPANAGKWTIHYSPATGDTPPTPCIAVVVNEATALSASGDTPDLTDHESYMICRMSAVECARLLGRDQQYVSTIAATLPDEIQDALKTSSFMKAPRSRPAEEAF